MQHFSLMCVIAYCVVSALVGLRLTRLALRTGGAPERYLGLALLLGGAVGYPMVVVADLAVASAPSAALRLGIAGWVGLHASAFANLLVWRVVFHDRSLGALVTTVVVTLVLTISLVEQSAMWVWRLRDVGSLAPDSALGNLATSMIRATPYALAAASSFQYASALRKRMRIGLADPVVLNRIVLWGLVCMIVVAQHGIAATVRLLAGSEPHSNAVATLSIGLLGLAVAVLLGLAFSPPSYYERWLRGRADTRY